VRHARVLECLSNCQGRSQRSRPGSASCCLDALLRISKCRRDIVVREIQVIAVRRCHLLTIIYVGSCTTRMVPVLPDISVTGPCSGSVVLVYGRRSSFDRESRERVLRAMDRGRGVNGCIRKRGWNRRVTNAQYARETGARSRTESAESRESPKGAVWPKASLTGAVPCGRWCA
jgi:hypothetical protein